MAESVYKVIELVGTSTESWEKAAAAAVTRAGESLRDLRVAEVTDLGPARLRRFGPAVLSLLADDDDAIRRGSGQG